MWLIQSTSIRESSVDASSLITGFLFTFNDIAFSHWIFLFPTKGCICYLSGTWWGRDLKLFYMPSSSCTYTPTLKKTLGKCSHSLGPHQKTSSSESDGGSIPLQLHSGVWTLFLCVYGGPVSPWIRVRSSDGYFLWAKKEKERLVTWQIQKNYENLGKAFIQRHTEAHAF